MNTPRSYFWQRHAGRYDRSVFVLNRRFQDMTSRLANDIAGSSLVLEIAAGTGLVTEAVAPRVGRLVATDRSPDMLAILRARVADRALTNVEVREADAFDLPFDAGAFDGVIAANPLHLLPTPERALAEV